MRVRRFRGCEVHIWDEARYLETVFDCGHKVPAAPQDQPQYRAIAHETGYGPDIWRQCLEHEMAHTVLAEYRGLPYSPTLWAVAHARPARTRANGREECVVQAFQAWCNGNPDALDVLEMYGFEWRELARLKAQLREE
jgi:hypothetical protein